MGWKSGRKGGGEEVVGWGGGVREEMESEGNGWRGEGDEMRR